MATFNYCCDDINNGYLKQIENQINNNIKLKKLFNLMEDTVIYSSLWDTYEVFLKKICQNNCIDYLIEVINLGATFSFCDMEFVISFHMPCMYLQYTIRLSNDYFEEDFNNFQLLFSSLKQIIFIHNLKR